MGYTLLYLSVLVLIPIAALFIKAFELSWADFWRIITGPRALAAFKLTFLASFAAAIINAVFGTLLAWVLVRYQFFGKRFIDALVDFPFALPTAVAGLTLSSLFAANGWLGRYLVPLGIKGVYTPLAVVIALTFVGLPFVVRTLQPVLENLSRKSRKPPPPLVQADFARSSRFSRPLFFRRVLTGFALAFCSAVGEIRVPSLLFSGNLPGRTEIRANFPDSLSTRGTPIFLKQPQSQRFCWWCLSGYWQPSIGWKCERIVTLNNMANGVNNNHVVTHAASRRGAEEPFWVRIWLLIGVAMAFALIFLEKQVAAGECFLRSIFQRRKVFLGGADHARFAVSHPVDADSCRHQCSAESGVWRGGGVGHR